MISDIENWFWYEFTKPYRLDTILSIKELLNHIDLHED